MNKKDYAKFARELRLVKSQAEFETGIQVFEHILVKITNLFKEDSKAFDDDKFWEIIYGGED